MEFDQLMADILWFFGCVTAIGAGITMLFKGYKAIKGPIEQLSITINNNITQSNERFKAHEDEMKELRQHDLRIKAKISEISDVQQANTEAMISVLEHMETGNSTGQMKQAKKALINKMIEVKNKDG